MTKPIIIANWKMNLSIKESVALAREFGKIKTKKVDVIVCPTFTALPSVGKILKRTRIALAGQNCAAELRGAYTGEVSARDLADLGCKYVIVGHSERRELAHETDEMVGRKMMEAWSVGLTPIVCIGETVKERESGLTVMAISRQIERIFSETHRLPHDFILAYEPRWTISTAAGGRPATTEDLLEIQEIIHQGLVDIHVDFGRAKLIYGGSVDEKNIADFFRLKKWHGFLVGGASLDISRFKKIVQSF